MRLASSGAGGAASSGAEQPAVERGRHDMRADERLRRHEPRELAAVAAADADDGVGQVGDAPLERQHHAAHRCRQPPQPALEHAPGDVVVADDHPATPGRQQQLRPGGIVAVEVKHVLVGEAAATAPEPDPQRQIEAQEAGAARDVDDLRGGALVLQPGGHQPVGQVGGRERPVQAAEMLGTAAQILRQRVVVVEDVDHGARRQPLEAIEHGLGRAVVLEHRQPELIGQAAIERSPAGEVAVEQHVGPVGADGRHRAVEHDGEMRRRQPPDQPAPEPPEHHLVEAGVDREVDQGVVDAAVGQDHPAVMPAMIAPPAVEDAVDHLEAQERPGEPGAADKVVIAGADAGHLLLAVVAGEPGQGQQRLGQVVAKAAPDMAMRHAGLVQAALERLQQVGLAATVDAGQRHQPVAGEPGGRRVEQRGHRGRPVGPAAMQSCGAAAGAARRRQQGLRQVRWRGRDDPAEGAGDLLDAGGRQDDGRPPGQPGLDHHQRHLRHRCPERQQEGVAGGELAPQVVRRQHPDPAVDRVAAGAALDPGQVARRGWPRRCPGAAGGSAGRRGRAPRAASNASSARSAPRAASGGPK